MADLPGLIEGASVGLGLGDKFLRHIERTKVIAHVVDMSGIEGRDPYADFVLINKELKSFSEKLIKNKQVYKYEKIYSFDCFCNSFTNSWSMRNIFK